MPASPSTFAISIEGVVADPRDRVLLLKNERDEWELPGGRIEIGESPEECVAREIAEETQWKVTTGPILDTWMYPRRVSAVHQRLARSPVAKPSSRAKVRQCLPDRSVFGPRRSGCGQAPKRAARCGRGTLPRSCEPTGSSTG